MVAEGDFAVFAGDVDRGVSPNAELGGDVVFIGIAESGTVFQAVCFKEGDDLVFGVSAVDGGEFDTFGVFAFEGFEVAQEGGSGTASGMPENDDVDFGSGTFVADSPG